VKSVSLNKGDEMPRKDIKKYRAYMREYMKAKRQGLTEINKSAKGFETKFMVGSTGLEPVASAMSTQRSNQLS
jgi:hypothetical protein